MDKNAGGKTATLDEVRAFSENFPGGVLLDVLTPEDFAQRHIPGSANACVFQTAFAEQIARAAPERSTPLLVYGAGQSLDAETARENLVDLGYTDITIFPGGLEEWRRAGLPLAGRNPSACLSPFPPAIPPEGEYELLAAESQIRWGGRNDHGGHWGYLPLKSGCLSFKGGLASGEARADMTAISCYDLTPASGLMELLAHLASRDFFHSKKYPEAVVKVTSLVPIPGATAGLPNFQAYGTFTIKGREHPVEGPLSVRCLADGKISASGRIELDRTVWGVLYGSTRFFRFLGMHKVDDLISLEAYVVGKLVS